MRSLLATGAAAAVLLGAGATGTGLLAAAGDPAPASERGRDHRAAAQEFVAAKRVWVRCVAAAAPEHQPGSGDFDPEAACGEKPRPSSARGASKPHRTGPPPWAGGPERRTEEPPGRAGKSRGHGRR